LKRNAMSRLLAGFALIVMSFIPAPASAGEAPSTAALIAEVRRTFTIDGKPIPPEIFRDFGDGDLADSGPIWVTVDVKASIGSNLYFDDIKQDGRWINQRKTNSKGEMLEETGYAYYGATQNGLLIVLASYSGGGSGDFISLHILDIASSRGFDLEGKVYERINLTNIGSIAHGPLGRRDCHRKEHRQSHHDMERAS
jgi:hypothetical protein